MKICNTFSKAAMFLVIVFVSITMYAQNPTYECRIMNDQQLSSTIYQFDVYIYQTSTTVLNLNNYQLSFKINNLDNILNDGKLSSNYVSGTSELTGFCPRSTSLLPSISPNCFRVNGTVASSESIIVPMSGLRIGTFQIINSVPFGQAKMDLVWNNAFPAFTNVRAMVTSSPYPINITNFTTGHTSGLSNPILNKPSTPYNNQNYTQAYGNASMVSNALKINSTDMDTDKFNISVYPNPFSDNTEIEYNLIEAGNVTITLYNSLGQQIAVLVNEAKEMGKYKFNLNSSDIAVGVYSCEIVAIGATSNYKKLIKFVKK